LAVVGGITRTPHNRRDLDQQDSMRIPKTMYGCLSAMKFEMQAGTMHISIRKGVLEVVGCGEASRRSNTDSTVLEIRGSRL
jgi:hypothetical protein